MDHIFNLIAILIITCMAQFFYFTSVVKNVRPEEETTEEEVIGEEVYGEEVPGEEVPEEEVPEEELSPENFNNFNYYIEKFS